MPQHVHILQILRPRYTRSNPHGVEGVRLAGTVSCAIGERSWQFDGKRDAYIVLECAANIERNGLVLPPLTYTELLMDLNSRRRNHIFVESELRYVLIRTRSYRFR